VSEDTVDLAEKLFNTDEENSMEGSQDIRELKHI
jgi:hypothetical protein